MKSQKFRLQGRYTVKRVYGQFTKFKDDTSRLYVPTSKAKHIQMIDTDKDGIRRVRSAKYKLSGIYAVTEYTGVYYLFSQKGKDTYVPERDIDDVTPLGPWWTFIPGYGRRGKTRKR